MVNRSSSKWNIRKLPQHVINRLKAGEIVERPVSVLKELLENAVDAGATTCTIYIEKAGTWLIGLEDNGKGIHTDDLPLVVERYATSKLQSDRDLERIGTYGFRGEALASIADVATFTMQTKQADQPVAYELKKVGTTYQAHETSFAQDHGTRVFVRDLFSTVPVRKKFLKSQQTEWKYIRELVVQYALIHPNIAFRLWRDGKLILDLPIVDTIEERVYNIYPEERQAHLRPIDRSDNQLGIKWRVSDATLPLRSGAFFHTFVNQRPVQDKIIKKAVMDAYYRQLPPGTYPCVLLYIDIDPTHVDVNVHPRKLEVKFVDSGSIYARVHELVSNALGQQKIQHGTRKQQPNAHAYAHAQISSSPQDSSKRDESWISRDREAYQAQQNRGESASSPSTFLVTWREQTHSSTTLDLFGDGEEQVELVGQMRQMYIVLSSATHMYLIDQHALAERITFERMKKQVAQDGYQPEILLQPGKVDIPPGVEVDDMIPQLEAFGFDVSLLWERSLVIYTAPSVLVQYQIRWDVVFAQLRNKKTITFDLIIDEILATKACKLSIKAGQRLHYHEMLQLVRDGALSIPGMFVCQHGRPSAIKIPKKDVDTWFDR